MTEKYFSFEEGYPGGTYDRVLVLTKPDPDNLTNTITVAIHNFCKDCDIPLFIAEAPEPEFAFPDFGNKLLIVAVGGDGTMLGAMRVALRYPGSIVYGVNTGTLGFLVEEYKDNISIVLSHISREFGIIDERMALTADIFVDGELRKAGVVAVNELVLAPMTIQTPVVIDVYINEQFVNGIKGSGVAVATSTGSTALASSAGGVIVSPSTNIMQIVPLLAHTLTSRPVITSGRDTVSLKTSIGNRRTPVEIYGDGIVLETIYNDSGSEVELRINKNPNTVNIYRPENWDFFNVLREKMKW